ncbi:MAG: hypothetical protein ACT4PO_05985 [Actinomycetota bacterium]
MGEPPDPAIACPRAAMVLTVGRTTESPIENEAMAASPPTVKVRPEAEVIHAARSPADERQ